MRRITTRAIIEHEGKFLNVRLNKSNHFWCTVGGGLDEGESVIDGLRREVIEETGVEPVIGDLLYVQQYNDGEVEFLEFFFHVTNGSDFLDIDLSKTTHGEEEIQEIAFIDVTRETVLPEFLTRELPGLAAKDFKQSTQFVSYL